MIRRQYGDGKKIPLYKLTHKYICDENESEIKRSLTKTIETDLCCNHRPFLVLLQLNLNSKLKVDDDTASGLQAKKVIQFLFYSILFIILKQSIIIIINISMSINTRNIIIIKYIKIHKIKIVTGQHTNIRVAICCKCYYTQAIYKYNFTQQCNNFHFLFYVLERSTCIQ